MYFTTIKIDTYIKTKYISISNTMNWHTIRALFTTHGHINHTSSDPFCYIQHTDRAVLESIASFCEIPSYINSFFGDAYTLFYRDTNCIDFLGNVYAGYENKEGMKKDRQRYEQYIQLLQEVEKHCIPPCLPKCEIYLSDENAIVPSKSKLSDAGYDLTIIKEHKRLNSTTIMYDTGVKVKVPHGYYVEIVPRSSLSKSGYMLANSVGVIDNAYRGNIYVALTKVDLNAPDIALPFRCCQLIFRKQIHMDMQVVKEDFAETSRGSGGFGSTGTS